MVTFPYLNSGNIENMKNAIGALLLITVMCRAQSSYTYEVEKVSEDVFVLKPRISEYRWVTSNIIVVVNDSDVLVVDSGLTLAAAQEAINQIKKITTKPVRYLVNTHWHGDHWQGNETFAKVFPGIEIIATEQGLKGMSRNGTVWATQLYARNFQNSINEYEKGIAAKVFDGKTLDDKQLEELKIGLTQMKQDLLDIKSLKPRLPDVTFSDKMIIQRGNREIQLLYLGIGNTSGDAIVYLSKERILITGDLVVHPSPYESGMFSPEWLETSKRLAAFDYQFLIPGHGDVQKDHRYLDFLNSFFEEIIKQINAAYIKGITKVDDIKAAVTHQTVIDELNKVSLNKQFTEKLESGFVGAAIQTSFKRIIQGKQ
jgi:cyclase